MGRRAAAPGAAARAGAEGLAGMRGVLLSRCAAVT